MVSFVAAITIFASANICNTTLIFKYEINFPTAWAARVMMWVCWNTLRPSPHPSWLSWRFNSEISHLPRLKDQLLAIHARYKRLRVLFNGRRIISHFYDIFVICDIGVAGSFSEGGQPIRPAKIQALPAKIFSCQGGPSSPILFCHAKLLCQTVLPMGKHCRWMAAKQSKMEEKQENMVETNQK